MTNSIKHAVYAAMVGCSNTVWNRDSNRKLRRINRTLVKLGKETKVRKEVSDVWCSPADGSWVYISKEIKYAKQRRPRGVRHKLYGSAYGWTLKTFRK